MIEPEYPKHVSQIGAFNLGQRAMTFAIKGAQFALVGFFSSIIGHGLTTAFVNRRRRMRQQAQEASPEKAKEEEEEHELGPLIPTSLAWGGFLLCSSNPRYQIVNGIEQRVLDPLLGSNPLALTMVTFALRFSNCLLGGVQWIPWAKFWGVQ